MSDLAQVDNILGNTRSKINVTPTLTELLTSGEVMKQIDLSDAEYAGKSLAQVKSAYYQATRKPEYHGTKLQVSVHEDSLYVINMTKYAEEKAKLAKT